MSTSHDGAAGDLAVIFDNNRKFAAIGLYDPTSPIRIRVLHQGKPRNIDSEFWADQLRLAMAKREPLDQSGGPAGDTEQTTGYRLVNGENDRWPGLIVDRYADVTVIKV